MALAMIILFGGGLCAFLGGVLGYMIGYSESNPQQEQV